MLTQVFSTHLPCKGMATTLTALVVRGSFYYFAHVGDTRLYLLRNGTLKRLSTPALKDIPTLDESGLKNFQVTIWHGLYAPKGTPPDVLAKLSNALKTALKDPEFIKKQQALGAVVVTDKRTEPAEHRKFVQAEIDKWGPIIKAAGVYAD